MAITQKQPLEPNTVYNASTVFGYSTGVPFTLQNRSPIPIYVTQQTTAPTDLIESPAFVIEPYKTWEGTIEAGEGIFFWSINQPSLVESQEIVE